MDRRWSTGFMLKIHEHHLLASRDKTCMTVIEMFASVLIVNGIFVGMTIFSEIFFNVTTVGVMLVCAITSGDKMFVGAVRAVQKTTITD